MTTFSELVDKMILECKRPDMLSEICSYLNQTLREIHAEPEKGNAVFYKDNLKESQVLATTQEGFAWQIPNVATFQGMAGVRFDSVIDHDVTGHKPRWAKELKPGRAMNTNLWWYYRVGSTITFKGYGGVNASLSLSWFEYTPSLKYFAAAVRPCTWDDVTGFAYLPSYDTDDSTRTLAQTLCTNWLLLRWKTVVEEGVRAKVYKRLSDTERARTSYSMYTTQRQGLVTAETGDVGRLS